LANSRSRKGEVRVVSEFDDGPYGFSGGYPPYESYADAAPASAVGQYPRYPDSWQPDYPHYPPRRPAGETAGRPVPPDAGAWHGFRPADTGSWQEAGPASVAGYPEPRPWPGGLPPAPRRGSGPQPAYRRDSGPQPAYRRDSGPQPAYRRGSSPDPGYRRGTGPVDAGPSRSGQRPRPAASTLLAGPAPDRPPRPAGRASGGQALGPLLAVGKRVPGWLPYGSRLVLLPPGLALDELDEELREHRDVNGGWLRPAVFGAMDGLVTNSSLIAGIGGGGGGAGMIVLTGIAGLIAGAFSMATGEYISVKSQNELTAAEVELERRQHARDPAGKLTRLTQLFIDKGVSPNLAEAVVRQISADPDRRSPPTCARNSASTPTTCPPPGPPRSRRSPRSPRGH
jgi:hypothetical protein